jgi:nucleoside phosphorylase
MNLPVDVIFVPNGAEYRAVEQGLKQTNRGVQLVSIPMGIEAVAKYYQQLKNKSWQQSVNRVLIMGLCGSLSPQHQVGDVVLYQNCQYATKNMSENPKIYPTDVNLTNLIASRLKTKISLVQAITCDRIMCNREEKLALGRSDRAGVVDMEGIAMLEALPESSVAILRVVSDDCRHNLPDLNRAFDRDRGIMRTLPLTLAMIAQPQAAIKLIQGATIGLKVLQQVTKELFEK